MIGRTVCTHVAIWRRRGRPRKALKQRPKPVTAGEDCSQLRNFRAMCAVEHSAARRFACKTQRKEDFMAYPSDPNDPNNLNRPDNLNRPISEPSSARYIVPLALVAAFLVALAVAGSFSNNDTASNDATNPPATTTASESTPPPANTGTSSGESGSSATPSAPNAQPPADAAPSAAPSPGPSPAPEQQPEQAPAPPAPQQ